MAINATDIVILKSERLTDEDDAGGQMTGTVIPNGAVNNLWDDIDRPLLATGGVSLRKIFCAVRSANTDKALGGHLILLKDSDQPNISTLLFSTADHYDERLSAQNKIEQYVVMGTRSPLRPVGTQRERQSSIVVYSEDKNDAPEIGSVLILKQGTLEQAVKITRVDGRAASYTYVDKNGDYKKFSAWEMTLKLTQPLNHDFSGADPAPSASHATEIYKTQTSASARYYGIKPLAEAVSAGARSVRVNSIFSPLVPAATTEQAILDQRPGLIATVVQPCGTSRSEMLGTYSGSQYLVLSKSWVPGSLRVTIAGSVYADNGNTLKLISGVEKLSGSAVVDARRGTLSLVLLAASAISATYLPGVAVELLPYTDSVEITAGNRQLTYTDQLAPIPLPGSVRVEFSYLGKWYSLLDDGTGKLFGPECSGAVNYDTGSVSFTLPGEPDMGTQLIYTWAQSPFAQVATTAVEPWIVVNLPYIPVAGTVALSWSRNSANYTASADAQNVISGHATGSIRGNRIYFRPSAIPTGAISVTYQRWLSDQQTLSLPVAERTGGTLTINTGLSGLIAGSVNFTLQASVPVTTTIAGVATKTRIKTSLSFTTNGAAQVLCKGVQVGTLDIGTGVITLDANLFQMRVNDYVLSDSIFARGKGEFQSVVKTLRIEAQTANIFYASTTTGQAATFTQPLSDTLVECVLPLTEPLLPGSVLLTVGGLELVDRGDGYLYRAFNNQTGAGLQAGQVAYSAGVLQLSMAALAELLPNMNASLNCAATGIGAAAAVSKVVFRTQASPLRPSGLQFLARRASDTALLRAESANEGSISGVFDVADTVGELPQSAGNNGYAVQVIPEAPTGNNASGSVNYETGVVELNFAEPVILSTLTYNAVSYTPVPLDPAVLKLNPVKLPTNGKVPVFQAGYLAVVHHSATLSIATPVAGGVIDCGRQNLAVVSIVDAAGTDLDSAMYTLDLQAGTVTLADPFNAQDAEANSLTLPLTLTHRVEDVVALGSVSIDGSLSLLTELTHDYPMGSYVSGVVHFGALQARVLNMHDRQLDNGFDDTSGATAAASYDSVNWPVLIDNNSAVKERWKLKFTSATGFQCIGERRGVIDSGSINADFSPVNPFTGLPYFTIKASGWGSGWVSSNVLRFDTEPCAAPAWLARTTLPRSGVVPPSATTLEFRVEAD